MNFSLFFIILLIELFSLFDIYFSLKTYVYIGIFCFLAWTIFYLYYSDIMYVVKFWTMVFAI